MHWLPGETQTLSPRLVVRGIAVGGVANGPQSWWVREHAQPCRVGVPCVAFFSSFSPSTPTGRRKPQHSLQDRQSRIGEK